MKRKDFETADLYLSSAICILLNTYPDFKVENGRTLFVFPICDELYKTMNAYNNGALVNAYEYSMVLKRLKAEMLMRRGMERQR
jgi:hypothetical protein